MAFYTEKRIENFLTEETRCLAMPDGSQRCVTETRLMWRHFDFSVSYCGYAEQQLIIMTSNACVETGLDFDKQLHEVVGYIATSFRQGLVLDECHPHDVDFPKLLPIFKTPNAQPENA